MTMPSLDRHVIPNAEALVRVRAVKDTGERVHYYRTPSGVFTAQIVDGYWQADDSPLLASGTPLHVTEPVEGERLTFDEATELDEFILVIGQPTDPAVDWPTDWVVLLGAREGEDGRLEALSWQSRYEEFTDPFEVLTVEVLVARFERERG